MSAALSDAGCFEVSLIQVVVDRKIFINLITGPVRLRNPKEHEGASGRAEMCCTCKLLRSKKRKKMTPKERKIRVVFGREAEKETGRVRGKCFWLLGECT